MAILLSVSIALTAGLLMTRLFKPLKLPAVTAYLIAGVLIGPYCLGQLGVHGLGFDTHGAVEQLALISEVALGFIAFSIGNEFRLSDLKKTGKQALVVGIVQALAATLFVDLALLVVHFIMPDKLTVSQVLTLGAIATATAPAATLMVVRQYKAEGPLTKLLLPIVALDDAVGLIVFAVSFGIARTLISGTVDLVSIIVNPIVEIVCSLVLGAVMGWVLTQLEKLFNSNTNRLNLTIAIVFLTASLSMLDFHVGPVHIHFSSLLTCMMLGTVFCNICPLSHDLMVVIGVVYIIFRCLGKYYGSFVGTKATKCAPSICKYLGITLFPQAGVALGMCATAMQLGEQGNLIRNITLFAVLIYELVGPLMTRKALEAAGEIKPMTDEVKNRRQHKLNAAKNK